MNQERPETKPESPLERRELSSVEVMQTDPDRGSLFVRASEAEGIELIRRLVQQHYAGIPVAVDEWLRQLDGMVKELVQEREAGFGKIPDYGVFLLDEPGSTNYSKNSWHIELFAVENDHVGISFERNQEAPTVTHSAFAKKFIAGMGATYIERMQDKILQAMQER